MPQHVHGLHPQGEAGGREDVGDQVQVWERHRVGHGLHDPFELWAQPNVAYRMRKIDGYPVRVERLTYAKD